MRNEIEQLYKQRAEEELKIREARLNELRARVKQVKEEGSKKLLDTIKELDHRYNALEEHCFELRGSAEETYKGFHLAADELSAEIEDAYSRVSKVSPGSR